MGTLGKDNHQRVALAISSLDITFQASVEIGMGTRADGPRTQRKTPEQVKSEFEFETLTEVKVRFVIMAAIEASSIKTEPGEPGTEGENRPPYKCCICPKTFHQLSNPKAHWRIHSGERPFKCRKCDRPFVQRAHLLKHLPTHSGEKAFAKFSCSLCGKKFSKATSLASHRRLHNDKNNHACSACGASFLQVTHLINHERRMHRKMTARFQCKNCKKIYKTRSALTLHCRRSVRCRARWEMGLRKPSIAAIQPLTANVKMEPVDEPVATGAEAGRGTEAEAEAGILTGSLAFLIGVPNIESEPDPEIDPDIALPPPNCMAPEVEPAFVLQAPKQEPGYSGNSYAGAGATGHERAHDHPRQSFNEYNAEPEPAASYAQPPYVSYGHRFGHQLAVAGHSHSQGHYPQPQPLAPYHVYAGHVQHHQQTQYLKQTLVGAAPPWYYFYNWNYPTFAAAASLQYHHHYQHQQQQQQQQYQLQHQQQHQQQLPHQRQPQLPVFYENGPYYHELWYNTRREGDQLDHDPNAQNEPRN